MVTVVTVVLLAETTEVKVTLDLFREVHGRLLAAVKQHGVSPNFKPHFAGCFNASGARDITSGGPIEKFIYLAKMYFFEDFPVGFDFDEAKIKVKFLAIIDAFGAGEDKGPWQSESLRKMCTVLDCFVSR